ncbi:hypothetical protein R1flu_006598 [Riccia fluitans]|uniref:Uncharacterized protein n=1 Tax=Riccia fluitans TaxID=41844 RepID=A0ABD1YWG1_9MARC
MHFLQPNGIRPHEDLVKELSGHSDQKAAFPKYEYHGKPEAWTSELWREVYNLPKANPGGYVMKGKVQFTELQLLKLVKGHKRLSKSRFLLEQVERNSDFILFLPNSEFSSCASETKAFSAQPTRFLPLCLVGHYGSYCTYAKLGRCG